MMLASWSRNRLTAKLGIDYPLIQGPLGGLSSKRLTAAVSNFGGIGSFGAHGLMPEAIKDVIAQIRSLTSKPFAMNLWVSMEDEGARTLDESEFNRSLASLTIHLAALGAPRPEYKPYLPSRFQDQARMLLDANVPAFSFIYGIPPTKILEECRSKGIVTIGMATTPDEAVALQEAGVDVIAASGFSLSQEFRYEVVRRGHIGDVDFGLRHVAAIGPDPIARKTSRICPRGQVELTYKIISSCHCSELSCLGSQNRLETSTELDSVWKVVF